MIEPQTIVRRKPDVVFRELQEGEGGVLLHLLSGEYHGLNQLGCVVWGLMESERTFGDLVAGVRDHLDESPESLELDISAFLEGLRERDLVEFVEPTI
jgi:hypothetical protein